MAVQVALNNSNLPFVLSGESKTKTGIIAQNDSRATVLKKYTVMAQLASGGKWTPFVSLVATTGASVPRGIYMGEDIAAATLLAGDVTDVDILVGDAVVDTDQVVFDDGTLSAASIVNTGTIEARTAQAALESCGIYLESTIDISGYENA